MTSKNNNNRDAHSREQVSQILEPFIDRLYDIIMHGWNMWEKLKSHRDLAGPLSPTSRANFVYDHMADRALKLFADTPGVHISRQRKRQITMIFLSAVVIRIKKFNKSRRVSRVKTGASESFLQQLLPQIAVHLGYRVNEFQTAIQDVSLVCPEAEHNQWVLELTLGESHQVQSLLPQTEPESKTTLKSTQTEQQITQEKKRKKA